MIRLRDEWKGWVEVDGSGRLGKVGLLWTGVEGVVRFGWLGKLGGGRRVGVQGSYISSRRPCA